MHIKTNEDMRTNEALSDLMHLMLDVGGNSSLEGVRAAAVEVIEGFDSGEVATLRPALENLAEVLERVGDASDAEAARKMLGSWEPAGILAGAYAGGRKGMPMNLDRARNHAMATVFLAFGRFKRKRGDLLCGKKTKRGQDDLVLGGGDLVTCPGCLGTIAQYGL